MSHEKTNFEIDDEQFDKFQISFTVFQFVLFNC